MAPNRATCSALGLETLLGMTMVAGMPRKAAAQATAAPWLPEVWVATPLAACCVTEMEDGGGRAARLEGADLLEVLALEEEPRAGCGVEVRVGHHRRAAHLAGDPDARRLDVGEGEARGGIDGAHGRGSWIRSAARAMPLKRSPAVV